MPVTADLGFVPDTSAPDLGFVPDKGAPQPDLGFVPDKYPGGLTEADWQHVRTLVPRAAKPLPDDLLGADIQRENARQAALDQPFAAVGPGGKIFQETPQNDPEANTAEFAKLWQVPGDIASAVAADSVAQGTTPITQALYGKDSTPPWLPINIVVALKNAFRNTAANPNPQPLPIDTDYAQLSQQHPVLATTAKISRGATASAPLLAVGGAPAWAGRLMALGFSAQMIASAGPAAQILGTELGKNPEDRDNDKISSATADLVQDFGFAPFAGLHGTRDIVESYADKPMDAIRQLSNQLQNVPIVDPAATGDQSGTVEANASDVLPSQATEAPKFENLAAAVQDLQDTLRSKLPARDQQTVNVPTDKADEILRNVFPGERQPDQAATDAKILGGAYKDIEADGGVVHHIPAKSVSTLSEDEGPAIWMEAADHRRTASWGSSVKAQEYRATQAGLINQGKFREAIQMDIADIRSKFGNKYDSHIQQMLDYYDTIPTWKLKPPD